jgi:hypothetical protein
LVKQTDRNEGWEEDRNVCSKIFPTWVHFSKSYYKFKITDSRTEKETEGKYWNWS